MKTKDITLIGAGLAGCLLAIYLARRGFAVKIFERRADMRRQDVPAGRSINLSLSERGIYALKELGLYQAIQTELIAMPGRMLHLNNADIQFQAYGSRDTDVHYSVSRAVLNRVLLDSAEMTGGVDIFFNEYCRDLNLQTRRLSFRNEKNHQQHALDFEVLIGTDGSGSAICRSLMAEQLIQCHHEPLLHGYKELMIPAKQDGDYCLEKNALHIWPRGGYMLIALPNADGSFTATLFLAHTGRDSFQSLTDENNILHFFNTQYPDVVPLMPQLVATFLRHPVGRLGTLRCFPWHVDGRVMLLGDAAHAIVPFHGQGMNCAFEDCIAFNQYLDVYQDWESLFKALENQRKPNTDAIADMALENYIEMRNDVRDPAFYLRKQIEWWLEERHPDRFIGRYSMVMFHRIPYAEVQQRGAVQSTIIANLSENIKHLDDVDMQYADRLVKEKLPAFKH